MIIREEFDLLGSFLREFACPLVLPNDLLVEGLLTRPPILMEPLPTGDAAVSSDAPAVTPSTLEAFAPVPLHTQLAQATRQHTLRVKPARHTDRDVKQWMQANAVTRASLADPETFTTRR